MKRCKPELLAPAGQWDSLVAAVQNGADAVYLGGKTLNARRGAGNFDADGLLRAADYLHERGKKLYVTVNTVVKQEELSHLEEIARELYDCAADAAIVQDFGVCALLSGMLPRLRLHASTQMAVHNAQGAAYLKKRGFERVVLAREMSLDEIGQCSACGIETEVFCHGALCVACSGQCLFSSLVGGRSGNRGQCAQPCRLPYTLSGAADASGYLLSPKDLMTAGFLDLLRGAGVASLKIEGRLKRPEYVAVVTRIYRSLLDGGKFTRADEEALKQIFNRGGFTDGYAVGIRDGDFISKERPSHYGVRVGECTPKAALLEKDVSSADALALRTANGEDEPVRLSGRAGDSLPNPAGKPGELYRMASEAQLSEAARSMQCEAQCVGVDAHMYVHTGENTRLTMTDGIHTVSAQGEAAEKAQKSPLDTERLRAQLSKTGGTPYYIKNVSLDTDADAFMPISAVNTLRRECIDTLRAKRIRAAHDAAVLKPYTVPEYAMSAARAPRITVQSDNASLLRELLSAGADDGVYFPADLRASALEGADIDGMFLYLPPVAQTRTLDVLYEFAVKNADRLKGVYITNIGQLLKNWPGENRFDFALNIANSPALEFLDVGNRIYTPSPELTSREIAAFGGRKELLVYGRLPLMHLRHCPLNAARRGGLHTACRACDTAKNGKRLDDCTLTDRMNVRFPLRRLASDDGCTIDVLNSVPLSLAQHTEKLPACESWRLIFDRADYAAARRITLAYASLARGECTDTSVLPESITTGHYFRKTE